VRVVSIFSDSTMDLREVTISREKEGEKESRMNNVVIKFGSSQCRPCEEDWQYIRDIPGIFTNRPVVFLYIQIDNGRAAVPPDIAYSVVVGQWEAVDSYDIRGFPTHTVIDAHGIIRWKAKGSGRNTAKELENVIKSLLEE
jgi:hypothetical protein